MTKFKIVITDALVFEAHNLCHVYRHTVQSAAHQCTTHRFLGNTTVLRGLGLQLELMICLNGLIFLSLKMTVNKFSSPLLDEWLCQCRVVYLRPC